MGATNIMSTATSYIRNPLQNYAFSIVDADIDLPVSQHIHIHAVTDALESSNMHLPVHVYL